MSQKMSTGLCNALLDGQALHDIFNLGFIRIFEGVAPTHADDAEAGTPICVLTNNDDGVTGLTFEATAVGGVLSKTASEVWSGTNAASGTVTHWRLVAPADDGTSSTSQPRVQGTIGVGGTDLLVGDADFLVGVLMTLLSFTQAFVPQ